MALSPFKVVEPASLSFTFQWKDYGTGGKDWGIVSNNVPTGYANLGDSVYESWTLRSGGALILSEYYGQKCLFVVNNRPDVAVPCTGYSIAGKKGGDYGAVIYIPKCVDDNYIPLGYVVRKGSTPPKVGAYYCVHRKYVEDKGATATYIRGSSDFGSCYRSINGYHLFNYNKNQRYVLRTDIQLQTCCTTNLSAGSTCELWYKGSTECQKAMASYCGLDDIKPGGKCEDWCTRDPVSCDKFKEKMCDLHPLDPLCDCINAFQRSDHAELIKGKEIIYNMSLPLCYYPGCKRENVYKTTGMVATDLSGRCAQDLKYIDQQIKVIGDSNVIDANMSSGIDSGVNADPTPTPNTGAETPQTDSPQLEFTNSKIFWIIIAVLFGILMYWTLGPEQEQDQTSWHGGLTQDKIEDVFI